MSIQNHKLNIGLFGFGVVGEGLYKVLQQTPTLNATIKKICIKHPNKKRSAPKELFTTDAESLLNDESINVIIELIDDTESAFYIAKSALNEKKALISASKKMIATHLSELLLLQKENKTPFLYEAACCASIPIIRNLEEYYDNDLLRGLQGIVNGSTNYILSRIAQDNLSFEDALKLAQEKGFAESNPSLDIEGIDAVNKLSILLTHAFGIVCNPENLLHSGIKNLKKEDAQYAQEKGYKIKLVAQAKKLNNGKIASFVLPTFVEKENNLYSVNDEYNGIIIESGLADTQFILGKGAGSFPTASAVLSDLSAIRYNYQYEYKKLHAVQKNELSDDYYLKVFVRFSNTNSLPLHLFEHAYEWTKSKDNCSISGIIHCSKLKEKWWKKNENSLVVLPNPILLANELPKVNSIEQTEEWLTLPGEQFVFKAMS